MIDSETFDTDGTEPPEPPPTVFEVFNPDATIGVACNRDGSVVGVHIDDDARESSDAWVADQILRLSRLAHQKSRLGLRAEMERNGTDPFTLR